MGKTYKVRGTAKKVRKHHKSNVAPKFFEDDTDYNRNKEKRKDRGWQDEY